MLRVRHAVTLATLFTLTARMQAQGRALQIEDYYRIRSVGAPAISPDGRWVAFTVTSRVEANNTDSSEVWIVASDGSSTARRVSPEGNDAGGPAWTDDNRLRFTTGGKRWILSPASGAPTEDAGTPARRPGGGELTIPGPDGRRVAHLRNVAPPRRDRTFASDFERRHEERFRGRQFDWLDFQRDGQAYPVPNRVDPSVAPPQEIFLSGTAEGERQLTRLGLRPAGLQWDRAGTMLLFTADTAYRNELKYGGAAVYLVSTDGAVRTLTTDREYNHSQASFSPDGQWVLYTRQLSTDAVIARRLNHGGPTDLVVRSVDGSNERVLTADWDYLPSQASWSPDGRHVYFTGASAARTISSACRRAVGRWSR